MNPPIFKAIQGIRQKTRRDKVFYQLKHLSGILFLLLCLLNPEFGIAQESVILSATEVDYPPFCFVDVDGKANGFSIELMKAALEAMGYGVDFRTGTWARVRDWLEKGAVQALPLVGRTPERESIFDFTFPYMSLHGAIVVRNDERNIQDIQDLAGKQVAVMKGDNAEEFLLREERNIRIHTTATFEEALEELSSGKHDAVVIQRIVALRLIQKMGITNLLVINRPIEGFRQDFCFAVKEGDRDMLALLNEGLALIIADGTFRYLHHKWFAALEQPFNRKLLIGGDYNFPPFEYLDKNGRPTGFNTEITRAIAQELGLEVEIILAPWPEILQRLENGEIDAIQGMFYSPERDKTFDFSQPHTIVHYVSVVRQDEGEAPETVDDLTGKRIVVQQGDIMHDFAIEHDLVDQLTVLNSQEAVLQELSAGKYDCALVARLTAMYWMDKYGWKNLNIGKRPILSLEYCYAVVENQKALLAQFGEGLKVLEESGEYRRIHDKRLGVYQEKPITLITALRYSAMVLIPLFLILLGSFLWTWSLRKQVSRRTVELRESERRIKTLMSNLPGMAYRCQNDSEWTMEFVSEGCQTLTGFKSHELIGNKEVSFAGLIHPEDRQNVWNNVQIALKERKPFELYYRISTASGEEKWVWEQGQGIFRENGELLALEGFITDITERQRTEEALLKSEREFREIFNSTSEAIFIDDASTGRMIDCNDRTLEMYGYHSKEEILQGNIGDLSANVDPYNEENAQKLIRKAVNKGSHTFEWLAKKKNGDIFWVEVSLRKTEIGGKGRILAVVRDISERKQAEAERERLLSAIEQTGEIVVITDPEGIIQYVNPAFEQITGYNREEVIGQTPRILRSGGHTEQFYHNLWETIISGKTWEGRFVNKRKDGSLYTEKATISPVRGPSGKIVNFVAVKRDITEEIRLETQLQQAQKMESIGHLAGGVAHDFNNILSVIYGYSEMALQRLKPGERLHTEISEILKAAHRSMDITRQLLAFARRQTIAPKVLDLNQTVENVLKMLRRLIGEDIDLSWSPGGNLWTVNIDPTQVDQILANLCVNARDAIQGIGKITIETRNTNFDEDYCATHAGFVPGEYVLLAVSDNGHGMDKETLGKIFEPFFTTKGVGKGTGLGMATVYGIVKQNNGFINIYSEPQKGTQIKIYLPRHKGEITGIKPEGTIEIPHGRGETILLVEDDEAILQLGKMMLESLGYQVIEMPSPTRALEMARDYAGKIDMLLTDVVMPEMNGRDLAGQLKSLYPDLKIIFMSGYTANVIAHQNILEDGVNFVQKPFSLKDIAQKVNQVLSRNE